MSVLCASAVDQTDRLLPRLDLSQWRGSPATDELDVHLDDEVAQTVLLYALLRLSLSRPDPLLAWGPMRSLRGFHSIRINDQWRIVFRWTGSGPAEVDVRDYH